MQFTNGGIRLNFGGYHAQAGLGGLLRGTGTGGGLHASVGTPWGAHAGAGLGGQVGGNDGTLGLYLKTRHMYTVPKYLSNEFQSKLTYLKIVKI